LAIVSLLGSLGAPYRRGRNGGSTVTPRRGRNGGRTLTPRRA